MITVEVVAEVRQCSGARAESHWKAVVQRGKPGLESGGRQTNRGRRLLL